MYTEEKAKELCRVLDLLELERQAAKSDATEHRDTIFGLEKEAKRLRSELESPMAYLFDEPEPTMAALAENRTDDYPPADDEQAQADTPAAANFDPREVKPGIDAYDQGVTAKLNGRDEEANPYHEGSYHWVDWTRGYNETAGLDE